MGQDPTVTVQLLGRYREGDAAALNDLYARYFDRIHAVVRLRMGPGLRRKTDSLDMVQEAFLASLRGLDDFQYRSEGDFFHWLCTITENRLRDQADRFAAKKRDAARERPLEAPRPSGESLFGPINELARFTTPDLKAAQAEQILRLEAAIDQLPQAQREALLLVRYEGLSLAEAGQQMDRKPDAVRMLVARAIVALAKSMGEG